MSGIFISYRRDDQPGFAGRLAESLEAVFGEGSVFRDVDDIRAGEDFVNAIQAQLRAVDVVLVMIGPRWLTSARDGIRRLDEPGDFVRLEIRAGLELGKPVIPVLLSGAPMPSGEEIPEDIRALARHQAFNLSDAAWKADVHRLVADLRPRLTAGRTPPGLWRRRFAWGLAGLGGIVLLLLTLNRPSRAPQEVPSIPLRAIPSQTLSAQPSAPAEPSAAPTTETPQIPVPARRTAVTPTVRPSATPAASPADMALALSGQWAANVKYDWGAEHKEVFRFEAEDGEVHGVATHLGIRRAIEDGRLKGKRLSFVTHSQEMLGGTEEIKQVTHRYRGELDQDGIRFTLESGGGHSTHEPVHFVARRVEE